MRDFLLEGFSGLQADGRRGVSFCSAPALLRCEVMEQLQELLAEVSSLYNGPMRFSHSQDVSLQDAVKAKCAVLFSQAAGPAWRRVFPLA